MVTSSLPGEGKSTTCLLLAHMSAQVGRRAIVVDCDLRRPTLHRAVPATSTPGLVAVLEGAATLDEAIIADPVGGMDLLPVAEPLPGAADVLSSARFARLVAELRGRYDLVLLDTPPALLVSDAAAVGKLADTALYAVRWHHTPRGSVLGGLRQLREIGVRVAGTVVTLVDRRQEARYAYAQYGYYAGHDGYYAS